MFDVVTTPTVSTSNVQVSSWLWRRKARRDGLDCVNSPLMHRVPCAIGSFLTKYTSCHFLTTQDARTPWYQDLRTWVGAASVACLTVFGVFADKGDDDPRLWGVFLGVGMLLLGVEFFLVARQHKRLCFKPGVEAASAGNGQGGEASV